jgi:hypothetical protein
MNFNLDNWTDTFVLPREEANQGGRSRQLSEQHRSWSLFCRLAAAGGAARIWIGIVEWEGEKQVGLDDLKGFKGS